MKLFGKRKKVSATTSELTNAPTAEELKVEDEKVSSYFSSDFTPPSATQSSKKEVKKVDHDIEKLLAMDPSTLTSKQRRVLRRYKERSKEDTVEKQPESSSEPKDSSAKEAISESEENLDGKCADQTVISKNEPQKSEAKSKISEDDVKKDEEVEKIENIKATTNEKFSLGGKQSVEEVAEQLKGLNSKERRKLLRKLASEYDEAFLEKVTEASKKIAEENEAKQAKEQKKEEKESAKRSKEESVNTDNPTDISNFSEEPKKKRKKVKDLSHLPPEERARREEQRRLQKEAQARRAAGEVLTRHPLNSERRRANRRKPGRAGKIALMKKQMKEKQENLRMFNASGYNMRHTKKKNMN